VKLVYSALCNGVADTLTVQTIKATLPKGANIPLTLPIIYRKIPFYYQKAKVLLVSKNNHVASSANIYLYFTPYQTVEVWNEEDFDKLPRIWASPDKNNQPIPTRIKKSDIPLSDLSLAELGNDSIPKSYISVPGLAYILVVKKREDPDRIKLPEDFEDNTNSKTNANDIQLLRRARNWRTWTGTVRGRLVADVNGIKIPITGIEVSLMQQDKASPPCFGIDDELATTMTDNDGYYTFNISVEYRIRGGLFDCLREGDALELYVKVASRTPDNAIRVEKRIGWLRKTTIGENNIYNWNYWESNPDMGTMEVDKDIKPQLVHWAYQCRRFVFEQLGASCPLPGGKDPLVICLTPFGNPSSAFFLPGGSRALMEVGALALPIINILSPITIPIIKLEFTNDDGLYIGEDVENTEETTQHEFGHYLMHRLQGRSWLNPLRAGFGDHSFTANAKTMELAWTEGWANGFSFIMDAFCHKYDNESGTEKIYNFEKRLISIEKPENNNYAIKDRGNGKVLTHGFVSEFNIGALLFDLYDGNQSNSLNGGKIDREYNDKGIENVDPNIEYDRVEIPFLQICQPLLNRRGTGGFVNQGQYLINHILDYHAELIKGKYCKDIGLITQLFRHNGIASFDGSYPSQSPNSDMIEQGGLVSYEKFTTEGNQYVGNGTEEYGFQSGLNVSQLLGNTMSFNVATTDDNGYVELSDPLLVGQDATLYLNAYRKRHFPSYYLSEFPPKKALLHVAVCGAMELRLRGNGKLQMGDPITGNATKLMIEKNSVLIAEAGTSTTLNHLSILLVKQGGILYIRSGAELNLLGKSQLQVEPGGYICIERGANVRVSAEASISIDPAAISGVQTNLGIYNPICGTRYVPGYSKTAGCNIEALAFDGIDDFIAIPDNSSINFGTSDFTVEAFVKPEARSGNLYIASKVLFLEGKPNSTGFGLLIDVNGGLFGWTMNSNYTAYIHFVHAQNSKLIDGKCHYVAFQRAGTTYRLYIDGYQYQIDNIAPADMPDNVSSSNDIFIGNSNPADNYIQPFKGLIGEFRLWNYARSPAQIAAFKSALPLPQAGLVAMLDMSDGEQQVFDISGKGNHARLGSTVGIDLQDPTWVESCDIDCNVEGNFRKGAAISDEEGKEFTLLPNPTNHEINIQSFELLTQVSIRSAQGVLLMDMKYDEPCKNIVLGENLSSGFYLVQLTTERGKILKSKFVKLK
jgi:hypothetical protein